MITTSLYMISRNLAIPEHTIRHLLDQSFETGTVSRHTLFTLAKCGLPIFVQLAKLLKVPLLAVVAMADAEQINCTHLEQAIINLTTEGALFFHKAN
jgi:hypothetical protein